MVYSLFKNKCNRNKLGNADSSVLQIFECADFLMQGLSPREENMFYEVATRKKKKQKQTSLKPWRVSVSEQKSTLKIVIHWCSALPLLYRSLILLRMVADCKAGLVLRCCKSNRTRLTLSNVTDLTGSRGSEPVYI